MRCPSCGRENQDHRQACLHCGANMVQECPRCSRLNVLGQVNCRACGAPLKDAATPDSKSAATIPDGAPTELPSPKSMKIPDGAGPAGSIATLPKLGSLFAQRYRIIRLLGEGSTKVVYLALEDSTGYQFALALVKVEDLDSKVRVRVGLEVRNLAKLAPFGDHQIVGIHDCGEESGRPYMVAQYMTGGTLSDRLRNSEGHRLDAKQAIRIADQICQALEYAHSRGVIHRDLKPASVWFSEIGDAKLGDFSLASFEPQSLHTTASLVTVRIPRDAAVNTVLYMPPRALSWSAPGRAQRPLLVRRHALRDGHWPATVRGRPSDKSCRRPHPRAADAAVRDPACSLAKSSGPGSQAYGEGSKRSASERNRSQGDTRQAKTGRLAAWPCPVDQSALDASGGDCRDDLARGLVELHRLNVRRD